jgi:dihydrofolate reductase
VSLDGFVARENGEIDWIYLEDEMFEDVQNLVNTADTALYGRVTYQLMESYWPTAASRPDATKHDIDHANWVNPVLKIVFSRSLKKAEWKNTRIVKDHIPEEIAKLKNQPGKNLLLFASPSLASTLLNHDLIDEYWFNINPIVLGKGIPLFKDINNIHKLQLLDSKTYKNGVIKLHYARVI